MSGISRKPAKLESFTPKDQGTKKLDHTFAGDRKIVTTTKSKKKQYTKTKNAARKFIMWDGEATQDAGYCLFGNSEGIEVCAPNLDTTTCLDTILETGTRWPDAFHVSFSFDYDVNNILRELSWIKLIILRARGQVVWNEYTIDHIPHKSFKVSKGNTTVRIDDIFSFFRCRYDKALSKYDIGTKAERGSISEGKEERPNFQFQDIEEFIRPYWLLELKLGVQLMNKIRSDLNGAGYFIGQWHGPGALASYALRTNGIAAHKQPTPEHLGEIVRTAFAGGWFERFKAGHHVGPIYTADINSAYAYAIAQLPSLANARARWRYVSNPDRGRIQTVRFGLYHIIREPKAMAAVDLFFRNCHGLPMPLFYRGDKGGMHHPTSVDGWYWNPEAELVGNDPSYRISEAWILDDDGQYPFAWVEEMYETRLAMQAAGEPSEKALKWILASLFGRSAQRVGWDQRTRQPPKWHQLEWAGYITSKCRAMVYIAAVQSAANGGLVSIDTDGVISTTPFGALPNGEGNQLGRWKVDEYSEIVYVQNGIYWLRNMDGDWEPPKARGIPGNKVGDPSIALDAFASDGIIRLNRHTFLGYGAALQGRRDEWRTWVDQFPEINVNFSGNRQHVRKMCRECLQGRTMADSLHDLIMLPTGGKSAMHKLPWLDFNEHALSERIQKEHLLEVW